MKTTVLLAAATSVPGLFLMQASGGSYVAVIDFERAISETPGGKEAEEYFVRQRSCLGLSQSGIQKLGISALLRR